MDPDEKNRDNENERSNVESVMMIQLNTVKTEEPLEIESQHPNNKTADTMFQQNVPKTLESCENDSEPPIAKAADITQDNTMESREPLKSGIEHSNGEGTDNMDIVEQRELIIEFPNAKAADNTMILEETVGNDIMGFLEPPGNEQLEPMDTETIVARNRCKGSKRSLCNRCIFWINSISSLFLYVFDVVSDLILGFTYLKQGDVVWGGLTLFFVFCPGFVVGAFSAFSIWNFALPIGWKCVGLAMTSFMMGPVFLKMVYFVQKFKKHCLCGTSGIAEKDSEQMEATTEGCVSSHHHTIIGRLCTDPDTGKMLTCTDRATTCREFLALEDIRDIPKRLVAYINEKSQMPKEAAKLSKFIEVLGEAYPQCSLQFYIVAKTNRISRLQIVSFVSSLFSGCMALKNEEMAAITELQRKQLEKSSRSSKLTIFIMAVAFTFCQLCSYIPLYGIPDDLLGLELLEGAVFRISMYPIVVALLLLRIYGRQKQSTLSIFANLSLLAVSIFTCYFVIQWSEETSRIYNPKETKNSSLANSFDALNVTKPSDHPDWAICNITQSLENRTDIEASVFDKAVLFLDVDKFCLSDVLEHKIAVMIFLLTVSFLHFFVNVPLWALKCSTAYTKTKNCICNLRFCKNQ